MSKTKVKKQTKSQKTIKRIFLISKVLFCIFPFATLGYLYLGIQEYGLTYQELLEANPVLAVTFLSAMCQPFAAWLLTIAERRYDAMDYSNCIVSILLIFIAECMLKNWLGIAATALLFFYINKDMPFSLQKEFKEYADWKSILLDASGCIVLILIAALCLYASLRLG